MPKLVYLDDVLDRVRAYHNRNEPYGRKLKVIAARAVPIPIEMVELSFEFYAVDAVSIGPSSGFEFMRFYGVLINPAGRMITDEYDSNVGRDLCIGRMRPEDGDN